MMKGRIAFAVGLAIVLIAGCIDSARDEAAAAAEEARTAVAELGVDVRSTLEDVAAQIERLDERYMSAGDDVAATWVDTRAGLREYSEGLASDLAELETASAEEGGRLKREIAADLEQLTQRFERAQLESIEDDDFVSASKDRMAELEQDLRDFRGESDSLSAAGRADALESMEDFGDRARDLERQLAGLADATDEEVDEERDDIAQALSSLTASVRRGLFEMRQAVTD